MPKAASELAWKGKFNLPFYTDTWDILAHTAEVSYTHPLDDDWTFDVRYRFYTQDAAEFYARQDERNATRIANGDAPRYRTFTGAARSQRSVRHHNAIASVKTIPSTL